MPLDLERTALVIIDPQNDFLSEGGVMWDLGSDGNSGHQTFQAASNPA